MSETWLQCTIVLQNVNIGRNWVKCTKDFSVLFLTTVYECTINKISTRKG